jgi:hypothetical protein
MLQYIIETIVPKNRSNDKGLEEYRKLEFNFRLW